MRAARVSTALVAGCLAALVLAPAALAAPGTSSGPAPAPARAAATTASTGSSTTASTGSSTTSSTGALGHVGAAGRPRRARLPRPAPPQRRPRSRAAAPTRTPTHPVICLPADSGEDRVAYVPAGSAIEFGAQVVNGGATAADAKIVITLPATLRVFADDPPVRIDDWYPLDSAEDDGTDLRCTQSADFRSVVCDTGTLAPGANILIGIPVYAADNAPDGQQATFGVALQPSGTSRLRPVPGQRHRAVPRRLAPADDAHADAVDRRRRTHRSRRRGAAQPRPVRGPRHRRSRGRRALGGGRHALPDHQLGDRRHRRPVGHVDRPAPSCPAGAAVPVRAAGGASGTVHPSAHPSPVGFWPIGTIAAGATAHVPVVVKAVSLGRPTSSSVRSA